jgi:hypothetical protein
MTVAISGGSVICNNKPASVTAQNVTIATADGAQDRWDMISVDNTGAITITQGSPADIPVQPDTTNVRLAYVFVYSQVNPLFVGVITQDRIQDIRTFVLVHTSPYTVTNNWYTGTILTKQIAPNFASGDMYLMPFFTGVGFSVKAIGCLSAGSSNATGANQGRLGIYSDNGAGDLTLLVDAGSINLDTTLSPTYTFLTRTIATTLQPGWYWFAFAFTVASGSPPTMMCIDTAFRDTPIGQPTPDIASNACAAVRAYTGMGGALTSTLPTPTYLTIGGTQDVPNVWVQAA